MRYFEQNVQNFEQHFRKFDQKFWYLDQNFQSFEQNDWDFDQNIRYFDQNVIPWPNCSIFWPKYMKFWSKCYFCQNIEGFSQISRRFGQNLILVKFLKFLVKYHKDFVQILFKILDKFHEELGHNLKYFDRNLVKFLKRFWSKSQNLVKNQYKNLKYLGSKEVFWAKSKYLLVKILFFTKFLIFLSESWRSHRNLEHFSQTVHEKYQKLIPFPPN